MQVILFFPFTLHITINYLIFCTLSSNFSVLLYPSSPLFHSPSSNLSISPPVFHQKTPHHFPSMLKSSQTARSILQELKRVLPTLVGTVVKSSNKFFERSKHFIHWGPSCSYSKSKKQPTHNIHNFAAMSKSTYLIICSWPAEETEEQEYWERSSIRDPFERSAISTGYRSTALWEMVSLVPGCRLLNAVYKAEHGNQRRETARAHPCVPLTQEVWC